MCIIIHGMPDPLLLTKLFIPPPRSKIVDRHGLVKQLNEYIDCKFILISAPAGFGKTTLVSEWIAVCDRPVAWVSLDEGDNDPTRFLTYLITALQRISENFGKELLAALQSPQPSTSESILISLLNEITSISNNFILVLDDYHRIDAKPIDHILTFLIEHMPPQMHLVITSREDPPFSLARLRARSQLVELRAADLRFSADEAADFLNRVMGLNLSKEEINTLETRTEGWIAGLQLAAISMQGKQDTTPFIKSFTGRHYFVLDYLIEEVLHHQPNNVQTFLLQTSILDRMCGPLCDAVMDSPSASGQETLEYLEHSNLFITPLDSERRWYRYHHLFGDLLRQRLGKPPQFAEFHLRASRWYEANHEPDAAFHHAIKAGDFVRAADLAEAAWQEMEENFQTAAWLGWVKKLPDDVVNCRPGLCVQIGSAYSGAGDLDASEIYLKKAEQGLAGMPLQDELMNLPGTIALIRASNAQNQGDLVEMVKYAELSLQLIPDDNIYLRAQAAITLGFTHWTNGNLEASLQAMYVWIENMQRLGNHVFAIASAFAVADMLVTLGQLSEAEKELRQAIQLAASYGQEAVAVTAHHHLGLALIAHERGDNSTFSQCLQTAADLGKRSTLVDWSHRWNLAQARLKESARDWDAALDLLEKARRSYVKNPIPILQPIDALKTRIYLKRGRLDKAAAWARERNLSVNDEVNYLGEFEYITLARVRLGEGVFTGVNELLERLLTLAENQKRFGSVIEILITRALVHQAQNNLSQALAALERALSLAEPEGYLRIFMDEGESMHSLLLSYKSKHEKQADYSLLSYTDKIVAAFSQPAQILSKSTIITQESEIIEPLTDRELEILQLISEGHSNTEISQRLFLALSTVKGHNLRIFNKLQVQNRTEAAARARELGLL